MHAMIHVVMDVYSKAAVSKNPDHTMRVFTDMTMPQKSDYIVHFTGILMAVTCILWFPYSAS
jgi:hypothetical protein